MLEDASERLAAGTASPPSSAAIQIMKRYLSDRETQPRQYYRRAKLTAPATSRRHDVEFRRTRLSALVLGVAAGSLVTCGSAFAQTTWKFPTSGTWSDATKWDPGSAPNDPAVNVLIDQTGSPYVVTLDDDRSINDLTINSVDATLQHTSGTLTLGGTIHVSAGQYQLSGGTISGGTVTGSQLTYAGGTLDGVSVLGDLSLTNFGEYVRLSGGTTVAGDIAIENSSQMELNGTFNLTSQTLALGDVTGANTGYLYLGPGSSMNVDNASTIQMNSGVVYLAGDLVNDGTVLADQPSGSSIQDYGGTFTNNGNVTATGGANLSLAATNFTNLGAMSATSGSILDVGGNWTNASGTMSVDSTSTLRLGGVFQTANLGTINVTPGGSVEVTGTVDNVGGVFAGGPGWSLSGTITGGDVQGSGLTYASGTLDGVSVLGGLSLTNFGEYVRLSGGTMVAGDIAIENSSQIELDGTFNLTSQTMVLGDVTGANTGYVYLGPGSSMNVDNASTIQMNSGVVYLAGDFVNDGTVLADQPSGSSIQDYGGTFTNNGNVTATGGANLSLAATTLTNLGAMSATSGSILDVGGNWTNASGTMSVDSTSTLRLGGVFQTANLGTVNVAPGGTVEIAGTMDNVGGVFAGGPGWSLSGTITGGDVQGSGLTYASGTLDGVSVLGGLSLTNFGEYVRLSGGTMVVGDIAIENSSQIELDGTFNLTSQTMVLGDVTGANTGYVYLGPGSSMNVDNASTIQMNSGVVYLAGDFVNDGTVLADQPSGSSIQDYGGTFTNNGNVTATGGANLSLAATNFTNLGAMSATSGSILDVGGNWTNASGMMSVDSTSTLRLGGVFQTANLGTINVTPGGSVEITGTMDNVGGVFAGGPGWSLSGTITGGDVQGSGLTYASGTLDGVSVLGGLSLTNFGEYVTLQGGTTVLGDIAISDSGVIDLNQTHTFTDQTVALGLPSGAGNGSVYSFDDQYGLSFADNSRLIGNGLIYTSDKTVNLDGEISPGFSAGSLSFIGDGNYMLGGSSVLNIELGGLNSGDFDSITANNLTLGGTLNVSLINGFTLDEGMVFDFLTIGNPASGSGTFLGLSDMARIGTFGGYDLRITYGAGDGNDVRLFSSVTAVPEPATFAILGLASFGLIVLRKRRGLSRRLDLPRQNLVNSQPC